MLNRKYERLTIIHFSFSSNTIWVWAGWQGRNNVSLHLYSVWRTERGERGCLAPGRSEPSPSAQYKLAKSTLTLTPLITWNSRKTSKRQGRKSNWTLDISVAADVKVKHCSVPLYLPSLCQHSSLCSPSKFLLVCSYLVRGCCLHYHSSRLSAVQHQPGRGWGKMSRGLRYF